MKEIFQPDPSVLKILRNQAWQNQSGMHMSVFVITCNIDGSWYLFHNLTKQCISLDEVEKKALGDGAVTIQEVMESNLLTFLADKWFLVPVGKDEMQIYEGVVQLLRSLSIKKHIDHFTILPTNRCNARCFYCFEENFNPVTMNEETTNQTVDYILRTMKKGESIQLGWFGGEPLVAVGVIDSICDGLRRENVTFASVMTSNGILIDDPIIRRMKKDWNLKRIQISVDGEETEYNRRKRVYGNYQSAYQVVMKNIQKLLDAGIEVLVRCNVDSENIKSLNLFIDDYAARFSGKKGIGLSFVTLYGERKKVAFGSLLKKCHEAEDYAVSKGVICNRNLLTHRLKIFHCKADQPCGCTVIAPDGLLYKCEHCIQDTSYGNIFDGILKPDLINGLERAEQVSDKCNSCAFLPDCTTFSACPIKDTYDCKGIGRELFEYRMKNSLATRTIDGSKEIEIC